MKLSMMPRVALAALLASSSLAVAQVAPVEAAGPNPPLSVPFLWEVSGKGTSAYLFGTIHLPDERILKLSPTVEAAFEDSDSFFAEIEATAETEKAVQSMVVMDPGVSLVQLLGPETWSSVEARFARAGHSPAVARQLAAYKPWVFGALVATLDYLDEQIAGKAPLDKDLYMRAQEAGKTVGGLETVAEQVSAFEVFSLAEQVRMLRDTLEQLDEYEAKGRDPIQEMVGAWLSGDDDKLMALLDDGFGKDPELRARAEASILWDRNRRLAARIQQRMTAKPAETAFFAIGALHLPDAPKPPVPADESKEAAEEYARLLAEAEAKLGVVHLLRKKGYTVTRVSSATRAPVAAGADK